MSEYKLVGTQGQKVKTLFPHPESKLIGLRDAYLNSIGNMAVAILKDGKHMSRNEIWTAFELKPQTMKKYIHLKMQVNQLRQELLEGN